MVKQPVKSVRPLLRVSTRRQCVPNNKKCENGDFTAFYKEKNETQKMCKNINRRFFFDVMLRKGDNIFFFVFV